MRSLVLCVTLVVVSAVPAWAGVRTWSSAGGKFSVRAELVEVVDGKARLRKEGGKVITVPVSKLSSTDRRFLMKQNAGASGGDTAAATPVAGAKPPAGLKVSGKAQWETPPPPLVVEIVITGKQAAAATSYGKLKLTKATTADGVNLKRKEGFSPGGDPFEGLVKIDRKKNFFAKHPKDGVRIALKFERPKGKVTKTGRIEGSVKLLTGGERKTIVATNLPSHFNKPIVDASLKAAGIEIKPTNEGSQPTLRQPELGQKNISVHVKGNKENLVEMILIDKNGKKIKTMKTWFTMGSGPTQYSFTAQGGRLPADVGLRATVVVGSKSIVVPFAVSGLKIQQPKNNSGAHAMP